MIEYAQWVGVVIAIINVFLSFLDKKIFKLFQNNAATNPKTAISIESLNPIFRWRLSRRRFSGFVLNTKTNTYYFDESLHKTRQKTRRFRLLIIMVFAIVLILIVVFATE
jgi:hypothetical protein